MKKIGMLALCCCLAFAALPALAVDGDGASAKPPENANGMPLIPDFTLPSNTGEDVTLSDFAGRQVVLYFWATWCPYCVSNMADKQALYEWMLENEFAGEVWAVNLADGFQETRQACDAFIEKNGYTMPVLYDETGELSALFGVTSIPVTAVIDAEGYLKGGAIGVQALEETITLLKKDI